MMTGRTVNSKNHLQFLMNMISPHYHPFVCLQHKSLGREGLSELSLAQPKLG
uniref:Uncharacterized protein n=1 Tax=Aquila chrysaetos chrysaetos TaxID=223781 RepID=A0A663DJJ8_AQUCH